MYKYTLAFLAVFIGANLLCPSFRPPVTRPENTTVEPFAQKLLKQSSSLYLLGTKKYTAKLTDSDIKAIAKQDKAVMRITTKHAGTAWLYAVLKNAIKCEGAAVVIPFSGWQLTFPELFAESGEKEINFFAYKNEPEIDRLAYLHRMPATEYWLRRIFPLYASRGLIADYIAEKLGFAEADKITNGTTDNLPDQEKLAGYDRRMWDFDTQLKTSLLPSIAMIAKNRKLDIYFVEVDDPFYNNAPNSSAIKEYKMKLKNHLNSSNFLKALTIR